MNISDKVIDSLSIHFYAMFSESQHESNTSLKTFWLPISKVLSQTVSSGTCHFFLNNATVKEFLRANNWIVEDIANSEGLEPCGKK